MSKDKIRAGLTIDLAQTAEEISEQRRQSKTECGVLFDTVSELLFRHDPIEINFESNTDEYEPEVETILPRLKNCSSETEVRTVVREEFIRWFDEDIAGKEEKYEMIAKEIWQAWKDYESQKGTKFSDDLNRTRA